MATAATGQLRPLADGRFAARIRVDEKGARRTLALTGIARGDEDGARERCNALASLALRVREAGHASKVLELLRIGARARAGRPWEAVLAAAADICSTAGVRSVAGHEVLTVKQLGERWASGDLHRKHPDHVKAKKHPKRDAGIARKYVDPVIGRLNVADVTLADCDLVLGVLGERHVGVEGGRRRKATPLAPATRRQVAQYMHRLLAMAAYPCRLRSANPIPENWLPKVGDTKAKECLYPSEDRALLACRGVPLVRRLAYGFMCREGMRRGELQRLTWADVDLERGRVDLDINKTGDGILVLSNNSNAYGGATTVSDGILRYGAADAVPTGSALTVLEGALLDITLGGSAVTVGSLASNSATVGGVIAFGGVLVATSGATLNFVKTGTGTLTLGGLNQYSGSTTVEDGRLVAKSVGGSSPLGTGQSLIMGGTSL